MDTLPPHLDMPQATVVHIPGFLSPEQCLLFWETFKEKAAWRQESIQIQDRKIPLPRLTAWHGDPGTTYGYSGINNVPAPWFDALQSLRQRMTEVSSAPFNSVLFNWYRSGSDSVAWHSDDEADLGSCPVIASVSLGAPRKFSFKHKLDKTLKKDVVLSDGDLLIMAGSTQQYWLHQIPKTTKPVGERINLTFRVVRPSPAVARPKW